MQPGRDPGLEDDAGLVRGESDVLAEDVDGGRVALLQRGRDDPVHHEADVVGAAARVLGRDGVRGQQRGRDVGRDVAHEPGRHLEHPQLRVEVEAVAGLDLDSRDPPCAQLPSPHGRARGQLLVRGAPGGAHRRHDAPSRPRDLGIGLAQKAAAEVPAPVATENDVGMAVDEAGGEPCAAAGDHLGGEALWWRGEVGGRSHPRDAAIADGDRAVGHDAEGRVGHGRQVDIGPNPVPSGFGHVGFGGLCLGRVGSSCGLLRKFRRVSCGLPPAPHPPSEPD